MCIGNVFVCVCVSVDCGLYNWLLLVFVRNDFDTIQSLSLFNSARALHLRTDIIAYVVTRRSVFDKNKKNRGAIRHLSYSNINRRCTRICICEFIAAATAAALSLSLSLRPMTEPPNKSHIVIIFNIFLSSHAPRTQKNNSK